MNNPMMQQGPFSLSPQLKSVELTQHILHDSFIDILKGVYKYEIAIQYALDHNITSNSTLTSRMTEFLTYSKNLFGTTDDNVIGFLTDNKEDTRSIARASGIKKTKGRNISEFAFAHILMGAFGHWAGATGTGTDTWVDFTGGNKGEGLVGPVHDLAVNLGNWVGGKAGNIGLKADIPPINLMIKSWGSDKEELLRQYQLTAAYNELCGIYSNDNMNASVELPPPEVPARPEPEPKGPLTVHMDELSQEIPRHRETHPLNPGQKENPARPLPPVPARPAPQVQASPALEIEKTIQHEGDTLRRLKPK
jgi:hypothetical protein